MKPGDNAPLPYRRAFVRLSKTLLSADTRQRILGAIRNHVPAAHVADLVDKFHPRDPSPTWATFVRDLTAAYALDCHNGAREARTRKADKPVVDVPDDVLHITVPVSDRSRAWIKQQAGALCVQLSDEQHQQVKTIVQRAYDSGQRPELMAEQLERTVGLTSRQEIAVQNFWTRVLDDTGDEDEASGRADKYAQSQLAYRAENISRTESHSAVEAGRRDEWLDAQDTGELPSDQKRRWVSANASDRLCEECQELDGAEVGLDEDFAPGVDAPPLHPSCRCTVVLA